jgi:hypothetical protein
MMWNKKEEEFFLQNRPESGKESRAEREGERKRKKIT